MLRVTKRADRNAPAATVDANATASRITEKRLRRMNDSAIWPMWTCAPPIIITSLDVSLLTTAVGSLSDAKQALGNPAQLPEQTAEIGPNLRFVFDHKGTHRSSLVCLVDGSRRFEGFPVRRTRRPLPAQVFPPYGSPRQASEDQPSSGSRNGEGLLRRSNLGAMLAGDLVTRNNRLGR